MNGTQDSSRDIPATTLAWAGDVINWQRVSTCVSLNEATALSVSAAEHRRTAEAVIATAVHALLYRYLDQDATTLLTSDGRGGIEAQWHHLSGSTTFRELLAQPAGTSDSLTGRTRSNLLLWFGDTPSTVDLGVPADTIVMHWCSSSATLNVSGLAPNGAIERLAVHAKRLISHATLGPDTRLDDLDLLDEDDDARFQNLAGPVRAQPMPATVHGLFMAQVSRTPERVAASCGDDTLSYRALDTRSTQLAKALQRAGACPGTVVSIHMGRSCNLLIAVLAILKAGAIVFMADPSQPEPRLRRILDIAGVRFAIGTGRPPPPLLQEGMIHWLDMAAEIATEATADAADLPIVTADATAYLIFTSGTTADPKAVEVSHGAFVNRMDWLSHVYRLSMHDVSLVRTALSFDPSYCEMLRLLPLGGRSHFLPHGAERDPAAVIDAVAAQRVTIIDLIPSPLIALLEYAEAFKVAHRLRSLRWVLAGAETLSVATVRHFVRLLGHAGTRLVNGWGATETTVDATWWNCSADPEASPVPIGRPIGNCTVHLLSRARRRMPFGMAGEMAVCGPCVATRSYGDVNGAQSRFVRLPAANGARAFLSGDRGRWSPEGVLLFEGRTTDFLKIRGVRTAPSELTTAILRHPDVREAIVHARPARNSPGDEVILYAVPAARSSLTADEVRRFLAGQLPEAMLPDHCMVLSALPRNASEKVEFAQLPWPDADASTNNATSSHGLVARLEGMWQEILGCGPPGADGNFFELGGHSLGAVRLIARVAEQLAIQLTIRDVYSAPTPSRLAERIEHSQRLSNESAVKPSLPVTQAYASHAQKRLWLLCRSARQSAAYHVPQNLIMPDPVDPLALQHALDELVARHEILRTCFQLGEHDLLQLISSFQPGAIQIEQAAAVPDSDLQTRLQVLHARPFDLAAGPLLRAGILRRENGGDLIWLTVHHIITDAWSGALLVEQLIEIYDRLRTGNLPLPAHSALQYRDYADWHRRWLKGTAAGRARDYWQRLLADSPQRLKLPTDHARSADRHRASAVLGVPLPNSLIVPFIAVARAQEASPFMAFLSSICVLLHRYSGQTDLLVGVPVAGRTRREFEDVLGCFVNSLPFRMQVSPEHSFIDLLKRVRESCFDALEHQLYPFDVMVAELGERRDPASAPLFDVMVVVQNAPDARIKSLGAPSPAETIETELEQSKLDLIFTLTEQPEQWMLQIHYDTSLFTGRTIERLADNLKSLLLDLSSNPLARLHEQLVKPRTTPTANPPMWSDAPAGRMQDALEQWALREPQRVAISFDGRQISYGELDGSAQRLAATIRSLLPTPGAIVAILLPRSDRIVEAQLAILKAGHAFLALNPGEPAERISWCLSDSKASLVLIDEAQVMPVSVPDGCRTLSINGAPGIDATTFLPSPGDAAQAAYVIYTSGSTGQPKGVVVEHRNFCSLLDAAGAAFDFRETDVWSVFHAFNFDFALWETFVPLSRGCRIVIVPDAARRDPRRMAKLLVDERVSVLSQVPSAFEQLARPLQEASPDSLRYVIFGGETINSGLVRQSLEAMPGTRFVNGYGITETTVFSTFAAIAPDSDQQIIGRPLPNQEVCILDERLQPVPEGAIGEICISGMSVTRGYLNNPELTAQRFIADPARPGQPLFRSGDYARLSTDGDLIFLGRRDQQIKLGGHRIELNEIRSAILATPGVSECVPVALRTGDMASEIVAFIRADEMHLAETVRPQLARRLPSYMLPSRILPLDRFPLLSNGKTDMAALERIARASTSPTAPETTPAPQLRLLNIWREVLNAPHCGVDDDFFRAGGDSLSAIRLQMRIADAFGVSIELASIFEQPTPREIARIIDAQTTASLQADLDEGGQPEVGSVTPIQRALWAIEQFRTPQIASAHVEQQEVDADVDPHLGVEALRSVFARFDIFRTTFRLEQGELIPKIDPDSFASTRIELVSTAEDAAAIATQVAQRERAAVFDLAAGPLARFTLIFGSHGAPILLCAAHHIIWDGASFGLTVNAWREAYDALREGRSPPRRSLAEQFGRYAAGRDELAASAAGQEALRHWRKRLRGGGRLRLSATGHGRAERFLGIPRRFVVDPVTTASLRALCVSAGATLFVGLHALARCWLWLRWAEDDITIGSPLMTRQADFARTPGPFLSYILVRSRVTAADSLRTAVMKTRDEVVLALRHSQVAPELAHDKDAGGRLFDVGLTLQSPRDESRSAPFKLDEEEVMFGSHTPVWFDITPMNDRLSIAMVFSLDHVDTKESQRLASHAEGALKAMISAPDVRLGTASFEKLSDVQIALHL